MNKKRYTVNEKTYAVPEHEVFMFLERFPNARELNDPQEIEAEFPDSKATKLYKSLISDGYTVDNLGTKQEFISALEDKKKAKLIYSALIREGYTKHNLGREVDFMKTFVKGWGKADSFNLVIHQFIRKISELFS